jgi:hypothetical protein
VTETTEPNTDPAETFKTLADFALRASMGQLDADDRTIGRGHPVSLLIESTLESLSRAVLKDPIIGFSRQSENELAAARRDLEEHDADDKLQVLLFNFEGLAKVIREAGYGGSDVAVDAQFFERDIPTWLKSFENWARATHDGSLAASIKDASEAYEPVAARIVAV